MYRKNVAGQFLYFGLVKASDGTALIGATVTGKRAIDGVGQGAVTGTITEEAGGQYKFAPSQADLNGNYIGFFFTATGAIPVSISIVTTAADPTDGVRLGLTALPNAAAEASGGLFTRGTGAGQLNQDANGRLDANVKAWLTGTIPAVNVTGVPLIDLKYTLGTISPAAAGSVRADAVTGAVGSVTADVGITQAAADKVWASAARTLTSFGTLVADTAAAVWAAATRALTTFGTLVADVKAAILSDATAFAGADVAAVRAKTDNLPSDPADESLVIAATTAIMSRLGTPVADVSTDLAAVKAETAAIQSDTNDLQARLPAALVGGRVDASVGAMASDALTAAALAADAVAEMQAGLATSAALATVQADTDNIQTRLPAALTGAGNIKADALVVTGKATLADVDGVAFADYMESILAVLFGEAAPSGSTVAFKKRDGTTTKVTVQYGSADGERTGSVIS